MDESDYKTKMVKEIRKAGGYARRFEDRYAVGIIDTLLVPRGYPAFWAEAKIVRYGKFRPTDRQFIELKRINEAGSGHMFGIVIGIMGGTYYFSENANDDIPITSCFSVTSRDMPFPEQLIQFYCGRLKK